MNRDETGHLHFKIVLWGPFKSGKTTLVKWFYNNSGELTKGGFTSVENDAGETVYFDYASLSTGGGVIYDFFAVGGSDGCARERKILLQGADSVVFVADSHVSRLNSNLDSMEELSMTMGDSYQLVSKVFILNKRDLGEDMINVGEFSELAEVKGNRVFEGVAVNGTGVSEAFQYLMLELVQKTLSLRDIPQAPAELTRMGVALLSVAEGFDPTLETSHPSTFSIGSKETKIEGSIHPEEEVSPSFATAKTDNFYLCSYHAAKRDKFGVSYIIALALPLGTPRERVVSLFERFHHSAPIILGPKDATSSDALKTTLEQFYIDARDHLSSSIKGKIEIFMPTPRELFRDKLYLGGTAEAINRSVAYLSLMRDRTEYELFYAPSNLSATYSASIPLDEYSMKITVKDVERLLKNLETRLRTVTSSEGRKKQIEGFLDEMKKIGGSILSQIVSKTVLSKIKDENPEHLAVEVDRDLFVAPLELLYDGEGFLCLRRSISRWITEEHSSIIGEKQVELLPRVRKNDEPLSILIIDSRVQEETLFAPEDHGEQLVKFFSEDESFKKLNVKVDSLRGRLKTGEVTSYLLSGKYDVIHFVAPAEISSGDATASSWLFYDGEIKGYELKRMFAKGFPQLVISYVRPTPWRHEWDGTQRERILYTLAYGIKLAGPESSIGAITGGVTASMMVLTQFLYEEILKNKKPIGQALKEARLRQLMTRGKEDDEWMKPILYGNPARKVT